MYLRILPSLFCALFLHSQLPAAAFSFKWTDAPENLETVRATALESEYTLSRLSVRGGLYFPEEPVRLSLLNPAQPAKTAVGGWIEAIPINSARHDPSETGFVHPSNPRAIALTENVPVTRTPLSSFEERGDEIAGVLRLPEAFGLYALILRRGDGSGTVLGSVARVPRPQPRIGPYRQVMAELGLPGGFRWSRAHSEADNAAALARVGIGLVRKEIQTGILREGETYAGGLDDFFQAARDHNIQVMITAGVVPDHPVLAEAGLRGGISRQLPSSYAPHIQRWFEQFARRYWTGGDSGLWSIEHFNEPWEPEGISGWNSDSVKYREILECIHNGVKAVDPRILVAGTSSVMNTEDKLLSGDSTKHIEMLDLLTDHYVSLFAAYGGPLAAKHGLVSGETETWGTHSQVLVVQFMTQFLSGGQKWINPAKESALFQAAPGIDRDVTPRKDEPAYKPGVIIPAPTTVGLAIWNAIIQDREFERMAFTEHLPYLYQFGKDEDARLVLVGKLTTTGSGRLRDYPWWQVLEGPVGSLHIQDPAGVLDVRDLNGNPVRREPDNSVRLPLDTSGFYLWSAEGAQAVIQAVRQARISGQRAVHIAPNGIRGSVLPVEVRNVINRDIVGELRVRSLNASVPLEHRQELSLASGEAARLQIDLGASVTGGLPLLFVFTPADSALAATEWTEVVQTTVIVKATPGEDPAAWDALPGATVLRAEGAVEVDEIEAVWLPFVQRQEVSVGTRRGEVKLAYDEQFLHVRAVVDAGGLGSRPRLATRDDRRFFWSEESGKRMFEPLEPWRIFITRRGDNRIWDDKRHWYPAEEHPDWPAYRQFLADNPEQTKLIQSNTPLKFWNTKPELLQNMGHAYLPNGNGMMDELPFMGDSFQFAINVDANAEVMHKTHDLVYPADRIPAYWQSVPDTDYEFSLYMTDDGKPELWCLMAPGVPRGHYYPRQERGAKNQHAVSAPASVIHANGQTTYQVSIPWSALGGKPWNAGQDVGFTFQFNSADRGNLVFGADSGATKMNGLTLHPYWSAAPSNTLRWMLQP